MPVAAMIARSAGLFFYLPAASTDHVVCRQPWAWRNNLLQFGTVCLPHMFACMQHLCSLLMLAATSEHWNISAGAGTKQQHFNEAGCMSVVSATTLQTLPQWQAAV